MAEATDVFEDAIARVESVLRPQLAQAVTNAENSFTTNPSKKGFDSLVDAAQRYDKLIQSKANGAPARLHEAHKSLRAALKVDRPETLDDYFATIKQVEGDLKELKDVIEGLLKAGKTSEEVNS